MDATIFDDLSRVVKAPRKTRLAYAVATLAALVILAGASAAWKSSDHTEPKLPKTDIGQILHPGVV
ncbi:hypothetical protein C1D09_018780 [Mesorhizobium intechi]|uniref:hypothetical protein n=1 Tax=Mesorhizobium intechi TaxID=537601 RepID=UPI000CB000D0|nr:hypothetical protein [Mesorhizobium intechi]TSE07578.1 hypothetical protein C1D09_018780 [Mesorhizobium intechi]